MKKVLYERPEAESFDFSFNEDFLTGTLDSMTIIDETKPLDYDYDDEYNTY